MNANANVCVKECTHAMYRKTNHASMFSFSALITSHSSMLTEPIEVGCNGVGDGDVNYLGVSHRLSFVHCHSCARLPAPPREQTLVCLSSLRCKLSAPAHAPSCSVQDNRVMLVPLAPEETTEEHLPKTQPPPESSSSHTDTIFL